MATLIQSLLPLLIISSLLSSVNSELDVVAFGAKGDGKTDDSHSFHRAWTAACNSSAPKVIYVPNKRFFISRIVFQGPCNNSVITIRLVGTLVAPDYMKIGSDETWLMFNGVNGISILGGYLDGMGESLWACKLDRRKCPAGATVQYKNFLHPHSCLKLTSTSAKLYHVVVHSCKNVRMQGIRIYAPEDSPNTDGIHVQDSVNVSIFNTGIRTGDDCVSVGPGTRNLSIQRLACGPGHGISIGSLAKWLEEAGVENVTVRNVVFTGTQNGLRIKSWGRPSNGFVRGVVFQRIVMNNVQNPIVIDQNYCPRNEGCPNQQNSGIKISHVTYADIKGTSTSQVAMKFDCSPTSPCKGIGLKDIKLTYQNQAAESFCRNIHGIAHGVVMPPSCV